jgi:hypothetical protein
MWAGTVFSLASSSVTTVWNAVNFGERTVNRTFLAG